MREILTPEVQTAIRAHVPEPQMQQALLQLVEAAVLTTCTNPDRETNSWCNQCEACAVNESAYWLVYLVDELKVEPIHRLTHEEALELGRRAIDPNFSQYRPAGLQKR